MLFVKLIKNRRNIKPMDNKEKKSSVKTEEKEEKTGLKIV